MYNHRVFRNTRNYRESGVFYWLYKHNWKRCTYMFMIILPWIFCFLSPLDFLQTTCSDAFTRFILRIGFLEGNSAGTVREIYSRRRQTRTITKYRNYESFMDGNAPAPTKLKRHRSATIKSGPDSKWHSFHSCANNWSLKHRWMSIDVARKHRINIVASSRASAYLQDRFCHHT